MYRSRCAYKPGPYIVSTNIFIFIFQLFLLLATSTSVPIFTKIFLFSNIFFFILLIELSFLKVGDLV